METKVDIPYETDENKLIETLRGICLPAVRCLNRLSKEDKRPLCALFNRRKGCPD